MAYYSAREKKKKKERRRDREKRNTICNEIKCGCNQVNNQQVRRYTAVYATMHIKYNNINIKMSYSTSVLLRSLTRTHRKKNMPKFIFYV